MKEIIYNWKTSLLFFLFSLTNSFLGFAQCPNLYPGGPGHYCEHVTNYISLSDAVPCNTGEHLLVWYDEFDGSSLDYSKWRVPSRANYLVAFEPENVEVSDNLLKIIAKNEYIIDSFIVSYDPDVWVTDTFNYTSGWVESNDLYGFGKFEVSCKIPYGVGFWPSFWMQWADTIGYYNEIDVFEFWGRGDINTPAEVVSTPKLTMWHDDIAYLGRQECACEQVFEIDFSADFHTFSVEWDYYKLIWRIDDVIIREMPHFFYLLEGSAYTCNTLPTNSYVQGMKAYPNDPMRVMFTVGLMNGTVPDANTVFPDTFEIDYFKYYKKTNCSWNMDLDEYSDIDYWNDIWTNYDYEEENANIIVGNTISINGDMVMNTNTNPPYDRSTFIAAESITIDATTFIDKWSSAEFIIEPDICNTDRNMVSNNKPVVETNTTRLNFNNISSNNIRIFPNPTADVVNISIEEYSNTSFVLIDNMGKTVLLGNLNSLNNILDLSNICSGLYFLTIFKDNLPIYNDKIIKY